MKKKSNESIDHREDEGDEDEVHDNGEQKEKQKG